MKRAILSIFPIVSLLASPHVVAEEGDLEVIHRIKDQAFQHSKVMDYMHLLADENGARRMLPPPVQVIRTDRCNGLINEYRNAA